MAYDGDLTETEEGLRTMNSKPKSVERVSQFLSVLEPVDLPRFRSILLSCFRQKLSLRFLRVGRSIPNWLDSNSPVLSQFPRLDMLGALG